MITSKKFAMNERPSTTLSPLTKPRLAFLSHSVTGAILAAGLILLLVTWFFAIQAAYWRHDAFYYIDAPAVLQKVREEGRWLNYLLYDGLRALPGWLCWTLNILCVGAGLWTIARAIGLPRLAAASISVTILLFPGFYEQNTWPESILPGCLLFMLTAMAARRWGWWIVPLTGPLFFATIPYFYFMLPLIFLAGAPAPAFRAAAAIIGKCVVWGVGLIAGYLIAAGINAFVFGHFGLELSDWRLPRPAKDLSSLLDNISRSSLGLLANVFLWLPTAGVLTLIGALLISVLGFARARRIELNNLAGAALAALVMVLPFLIVIPSGILVQSRSLLPMAAGLIWLPVMLSAGAARPAIIAALGLFIGLPSGWQALQATRWYAEFSQAHIENIRSVLPAGAGTFDWVYIDIPDAGAYGARVQGTLPPGVTRQYFQEDLVGPDRLVTPLRELGATMIVPCQFWPHERCEAVRQRAPSQGNCGDPAHGAVCALAEGGDLLISVQP